MFSSKMTVGAFKQALVEYNLTKNVKLGGDQYNPDYYHWDFDIPCDQFSCTSSIEKFVSTLNNLKSFDFKAYTRFPLYEISSACCTEAFPLIQLKNAKVRLWGKVHNKEWGNPNCELHEFRFMFYEKTFEQVIAKAWVDYVKGITVSDFSALTPQFSFKFAGLSVKFESKELGYNVVSLSKPDYSNLGVQGQTNVLGMYVKDYVELRVMFTDYFSLDVAGNYRITFFFEVARTGKMGEKPIPFIGLFDKTAKIYYKGAI